MDPVTKNLVFATVNSGVLPVVTSSTVLSSSTQMAHRRVCTGSPVTRCERDRGEREGIIRRQDTSERALGTEPSRGFTHLGTMGHRPAVYTRTMGNGVVYTKAREARSGPGKYKEQEDRTSKSCQNQY